MSIFTLLGLGVGIIVLWIITAYNGFVRMKNRVNEAWADIETQLKRRYDLVPNLVETVKGYMAHEQNVFEKVTQMRASAMSAQTFTDKAKTEGEFSQALKTLFAVSENYPELKANQNFIELQRELADTEDKIQASRRFYNGVARDYATALESFPSVLIARAFHFQKRDLFEIENEAEREPVKVSFK